MTANPANACAGDLREYVESELNVRSVETCNDPLEYAVLRAEPEWQVGAVLCVCVCVCVCVRA